MSNGTPSMSGGPLLRIVDTPSSIVTNIKRAIKQVAIDGMRAALSAYEGFGQIPVFAEYPAENEKYPCIVAFLSGLKISHTGLGKETWFYDVSSHHYQEQVRFFEATLGFWHGTWSLPQLAVLSDIIIEVISFDPESIFLRTVYQKIPGVVCMTDQIVLQGEGREAPPQGGDKYLYYDTLQIPVYGEIGMRGEFGVVSGVEVVGVTEHQDYPEGWEW